MPIQTAEQAHNVFGAPKPAPTQSIGPVGGAPIPSGTATGTTGGQANPHTDTGFSGGQYLASGALNPGYTPPGPGSSPGAVGGPPPPPPDDDPFNITGSGATGGDDTTQSPYFTSQLDAFDFQPKFGIENYYQYLMDKEEATGGNFINSYKQSLIANEPAEVDLMPSSQQGFNYSITNPNKLSYTTAGGGTFTGQVGLDNLSLMFKQPFQEGGPVGEPEIDQSGIASLYPATDEMYPEDDPYIPGKKQMYTEDQYDYINKLHKDFFGERSKVGEGFGATRENVGEQLEAFRNAPVHVDPPNLGFMGESVPAPLFDRAMKYLESLPPSERAVIEEMFRENIMKKRQDQLNDLIELKETYGYLDA